MPKQKADREQYRIRIGGGNCPCKPGNLSHILWRGEAGALPGGTRPGPWNPAFQRDGRRGSRCAGDPSGTGRDPFGHHGAPGKRRISLSGSVSPSGTGPEADSAALLGRAAPDRNRPAEGSERGRDPQAGTAYPQIAAHGSAGGTFDSGTHTRQKKKMQVIPAVCRNPTPKAVPMDCFSFF